MRLYGLGCEQCNWNLTLVLCSRIFNTYFGNWNEHITHIVVSICKKFNFIIVVIDIRCLTFGRQRYWASFFFVVIPGVFANVIEVM